MVDIDRAIDKLPRWVRRPRLGGQMSAWIPTFYAIVMVAVTTATSANAGGCSRETSRNCLNFPAVLDFSSVPAISEQIVTEARPDQTQHKLTTDPPAPAPYTGPSFGTSLGRKAPTVGYRWSLE
jgi:hypothetical protein